MKSLRTFVSSSSDNAVTLYHSDYVPRCVALLAAGCFTTMAGDVPSDRGAETIDPPRTLFSTFPQLSRMQMIQLAIFV